MNNTNRIELPLHDAIELALSSITLRKNSILHNIFYLVGKPGGGKTMLIDSLVKQYNYGFLPYSPGLERIEKFGGIPDLKYVDGGGSYLSALAGKELHTVWSIPSMICDINKECENNKEGVVVLLDDWHLCTEELQQIGFELFTYYSLNGHKVNKNVIFILAGNETSAAGAKVQLSAIKNRCTMIYTYSDINYWLTEFAIPNNIYAPGISYFQNKANHMYFQEDESTVSPFGSPRSWTSAFNLISHLVNTNKYSDLLAEVILQGSVSNKAASSFSMYNSIFRNINVNEVFDNHVINIPLDPVEKYCYFSAINYEFYKRYNSGNDVLDFMNTYKEIIAKAESSSKEMIGMMIFNLSQMKSDNCKSGYEILINMKKENILDEQYLNMLKNILKNK